ncbi:anti-sigma factor family protein [Streptomyces tsukubensis]|uniref:Putative zinc-finger domain-containing protein n=1 Tax=Streptomyces tsukubensis TaxID=83656 RepID=A0A1V4ABR3_9ACTN|nr:zf-HC2 domain-containing protein [Streptomyces tsukubensis]OON81301.1 hypothetical protein B1H18_08085 [Streptomyces tsukubensis]QFR95585.1 zf-HC2 domain-containing protein [Streptomyces tsukubensis]
MSGSRPTPAEQHLGDRLAALVDGELNHDARERVLAHLATCAKCKAEADAQRRLKSVFAHASPPPPSQSFLERLQGLPGGGDGGAAEEPFGRAGLRPGAFGGGAPRSQGAPGVLGMRQDTFGYIPEHAPALTSRGPRRRVSLTRPVPAPLGPTAPPGAGRGFRIHDVGRSEAERSASRGRRFAFAAAGAVSLAAIALGGVSTVPTSNDAGARGAGSGSNATPARSPGAASTATSESTRRRNGGSGQSGGALSVSTRPTSVVAPLLPGAAVLAAGVRPPAHPLSAPFYVGPEISPLPRAMSYAAPGTATVPETFLSAATRAAPAPTTSEPLAPGLAGRGVEAARSPVPQPSVSGSDRVSAHR